FNGYPFTGSFLISDVTLPVQGSAAAPPILPTSSTPPPYTGTLTSFADYKTPRTWQWNATIDQELGAEGSQHIILSYVGAHGEHLQLGLIRFSGRFRCVDRSSWSGLPSVKEMAGVGAVENRVLSGFP